MHFGDRQTDEQHRCVKALLTVAIDVEDQNWRVSRLGEQPKKFGTPYVFLQPLKLTSSNVVHELGSGLA